MTSRRVLSLAGAILATVVIGYFVLAELKWSDVVALRATSDLRWLALGFLAYLCANVVRARRFRALTSDQLDTRLLLRTVLVQNLLNTFLPLRAGEASYLYMVHRTGAVNLGENVGSLLGARVLDLLAALLIPLATLPLSRAWHDPTIPFAWLLAAPCLGVAALALAIWRAEAIATAIAARAHSNRAWLNKSLLLASDVLRSFARLRQGSLLGRVTLLTLVSWTLLYVSGYLGLRGVGLALPFFDAVLAYGFPVVASLMPFFMLGGFGIYEGSIGVGLSLVHVPLGPAMAAGLALHVAELLYILLPGPFTLIPQLWPRGRTPA